jgi:hypothetical protein
MHRSFATLPLPICYLFLLLAGCTAAAPGNFHGQTSPLRATSVVYLEDSTGELRINDMLQPQVASRFRPVNTDGVANFGMKKSAIWGRIDLTADDDVTVIAELSTTRLDHITWWEVRGQNVKQEIRNGWYDGKPGQPAPQKYPAISIQLARSESCSVFFRTTSDCSLTLPLTIAGSEPFSEISAGRLRFDLLQTGATFATIGLCLLLAISFRDWMYVHLALCCITGVLYGMAFDTVLSLPMFQLPPWISRVGCSLAATSAAMAMLAFCARFDGWRNLSRSDQFLAITGLCSCVLFIVAQLIIPFRVSIIILTWFLAFSGLLGLWLLSSPFRKLRRSIDLAMVACILILHFPGFLLALQFERILPTYISPQTLRFISTPTVVSGLVCVMLNRQRSTEILNLRVADARARESEARLAALRYQLNPHMLLNSLTAVAALSQIDPNRIPALVDSLGIILRSRLKPAPGELWKLTDELDVIRALVTIEQARFGDTLVWQEAIEPQAASCLLPDLILQPLVENALKYGCQSSTQNLVSMEARFADNRLIVNIVNIGNPATTAMAPKGLGIGLENIRRRLDVLYGTSAKLCLKYAANNVTAEISIPQHDTVGAHGSGIPQFIPEL